MQLPHFRSLHLPRPRLCSAGADGVMPVAPWRHPGGALVCTRGGYQKPLCLQPFWTLFRVQGLTIKVCVTCLSMPLPTELSAVSLFRRKQRRTEWAKAGDEVAASCLRRRRPAARTARITGRDADPTRRRGTLHYNTGGAQRGNRAVASAGQSISSVICSMGTGGWSLMPLAHFTPCALV